MEWIRRGRQIGLAVKSAPRLRQIVSVFARHGFGEVLDRMDLARYVPTRFKISKKNEELSTAVRLKHAFEELGPTFVKLGQLLSTRPDIMPEDFIEEFTKLQDDVSPVLFEDIKRVIEDELGKSAEQAFQSINPTPLASASIAQVHEATLKTGERVVIKVQRPGIQRIIDDDISILTIVAALLDKYVPETRIANPRVIVSEFFQSLSTELDFFIESNNMEKIRENLADMEEVVVPKVYHSYSTHRILTQEKLEGLRVNDREALKRAGIDTKRVARIGARAFFKAVMIDGIFHGDLHGGNLFVLPGNRIGIIDFGIVGRLSEKARDQLANMVISLLNEDFENLCYQYAELGAAPPSVDFDAFQRDLRNTLSPYMGLNLSQLNSGKVLIEATKIAAKYQIVVPGDWMVVFKAIVTMEGMGRSLDPELDMLELGQEFVQDLIKNQYSVQRLTKDATFIAKDIVTLFQVLPRQIRWMFRKFNRNDFAIEIKVHQLDELGKRMEKNSRRNASAVLSAALFLAATLALNYQAQHTIMGYPALSVLGFIAGAVLLIGALFR